MVKRCSAHYSVLAAGKGICFDVEQALKSGLKVILFLDSQEKEATINKYKAFSDTDFLNVYENSKDINAFIEDGVITDNEILGELEATDLKFNSEQYQIEHEESSKNIIVEAGAGTGKTHVMINRIMYLMHMDKEFDFSKVTMITFTNKATDNMRHKLIEKLNRKYALTGELKYLDKIEEASQINISTIHAFFKKVIIEVGPILGYGMNVQLKSYAYEKRELLRELLNNIYCGNKRVEEVIGLTIYQIEELALEYWAKLDNNGISDDEIRSLNWGKTNTEKAKLIQNSLIAIFKQVDEKYNEIKYINNAISMKDIIHELNRVIDRPGLKDYINKEYKYMFCDEFQDSDNVQIQTVAMLNRMYNGNLFVVGDIKQSIYRFRGATDSAFSKLKDILTKEEKACLITRSLTKNYRTSATILNELDTIFQVWGSSRINLLKYVKSDRLVPQKEGSKKSEYRQIPTKENERESKVIETIHFIQEKSEHKKITCLVRKNSQLKIIKRWCEKEKIACLIKERGSFFSSDAVLDFCALIEAYLYDNEPMYLYNYVMSSYGSGKIDIEGLEKCDGNKFEIMGVILEEINIEQWNRYRYELANKPVMAVLREMISEISPVKNYGLRKKAKLLAKNYPKKLAVEQSVIDTVQYEANLKKLLQILTNQFSRDFASLLDLCEFVRLKIMTDKTEEPAETEISSDTDCVEGLTVHAAKGLEFENVLIPFMNDEFYQRFRSEILVSKDGKSVGWVYRDKKEDDIKNQLYDELILEEDKEVAREETRLLYVAMTRAIYGLFCFVNRNKKNNEIVMSWTDLLPEEKDYAKDL